MSNILQDFTELSDAFDQYKKESIKWSVADFWFMARQELYNDKPSEDPLDVTNEEIKAVYDTDKFQEALEKMIDKHDPEYGITWETVRVYLEDCER